MSANVTLRLKEEILKKCRLIAVKEEKSLSQWLTDLLEEIITQRSDWESAKKSALRRLDNPFDLKGKPLSRDELYERK